MTPENISAILKASKRNKVKYRDEFNFIIWGISFSNEIESDGNIQYILIDSNFNKVNINKIIEIRVI